MKNSKLAFIVRTILKLTFIILALRFFISGIWGNDLTVNTFDHCLRFFTVMCCIARASYGNGTFNDTGTFSLWHLLKGMALISIGAIAGHLLYAYVISKMFIILGKLIGGLIVIGIILLFVVSPIVAAASEAARLAAMGADTVRNNIRNGDLKMYSSDYRLKQELYVRTGVDYDEERKVYEDYQRRHGLDVE